MTGVDKLQEGTKVTAQFSSGTSTTNPRVDGPATHAAKKTGKNPKGS